MVDTIKLQIPISNPYILGKTNFTPLKVQQLVENRGTQRTYLNPSKKFVEAYGYVPRITMYKRPNRHTFGVSYSLAVEFSAPKLLFGNNFDELRDSDLDALVKKIIDSLLLLTGHRFFPHQIREATVSAWHPSKNIVFLDFTSTQTILNTLKKVDVRRSYDFQHTDFREGHVLHIHTNTLDIAMYDKLADLKRSKISPKRAIEKQSYVQMDMLEALDEHRPIEIFRYEVRLIGIRSIRKWLPNIKQHTLENMFKASVSKNCLLQHWNTLTEQVDMLGLDIEKPYELLANYSSENQEATPQSKLAAVGGLLAVNQVGFAAVRTAIEQQHGANAWYRIKKLLKAPEPYRSRAFVRIDEVLDKFNPVTMKEFKNDIEKTIKKC